MTLAERLECWVVTDGRAGIEAQALGLAEAIASRRDVGIRRKRIVVRAPWRHLPRQLWGDPFVRLDPAGDLLTAPFPDLWVGCGRLSVPLSLAVKRRSPRTFVIQLQNPRAPLSGFDLVIAPEHDRLSGANAISIIGPTILGRALSPVRAISEQERRVAAMIGGPNRAFALSPKDAERIGEELRALADSGVRLMVTTSRRTPADAAEILEQKLGGVAEIFWRADRDDSAANPLQRMLDEARAFIVTEDSVNMSAEAATTGAIVHVLRLRRKPAVSAQKFDDFHQSLIARGNSRYFDGVIDWRQTEPLNETMRAATEALKRFSA